MTDTEEGANSAIDVNSAHAAATRAATVSVQLDATVAAKQKQ